MCIGLTPAPVEKMVALTDRAVIARMVKRLEPMMRRRVAELLEWLRTRHTMAEIEVAVVERELGQMLSDADVRRMAAALATETGAIYVAAARGVSEVIAASLKQPMRFDSAVARAVEHLKAGELRLVRGFINEQREIVTEVLGEGLTGGLNPKQTARLFRDVVGLAPNQVKAVASYRRALETGDFRDALGRKLRDRRFDRLVRAARKAGKGLGRAEVDRMVTRYAERSLKMRAETIALTETLGAIHAGADEAWEQAVDSGDIDPETIVEEWISTRDKRTRDSHRTMHRQKRRHGQPFLSGAGNLLRYPHDPNAPASERIRCRCMKVRRVVTVEEQAAAAAREAGGAVALPLAA